VSVDISVVIPVRNESKTIERCIEAIMNQSLAPCEIIVVDGCSTDNTTELAGKYPVKVVREYYRTRAGACRIGVKLSKGEYVAFTDGDCLPDKKWLENLAAEFGPDVVGAGGCVDNCGEDFWVKVTNLAMNSFLGCGYSVQGRTFAENRVVSSISGCNSMYRKEAILEAGSFEPSLSGCEDAHLNSRLVKTGKLIYTPKAVVHHEHGRSLKEFAQNMIRYGQDRARARIFGLPLLPALAAPVIVLLGLFNLLILKLAFFSYLFLSVFFAFKLSLGQKKINLAVPLILVFFIEHSFYIYGFWAGLIYQPEYKFPQNYPYYEVLKTL